MIEITPDEWYDKFEPVRNHIDPTQGNVFETYGEESAYIYSIDPHFVWTEMDGDDGGVYIVKGRHFVNRICYYVTRLAWQDNESYEICVVDPEFICFECGDSLTEDEDGVYDGYCEQCYKAQGLGD